jgi:hypothetical protein
MSAKITFFIIGTTKDSFKASSLSKAGSFGKLKTLSHS